LIPLLTIKLTIRNQAPKSYHLWGRLRDLMDTGHIIYV